MLKQNSSETNPPIKHNKTPWHLWVVALFFGFIYVNGIYDFFMIQSQDLAYYHTKGFSDAVFKYFSNYPLAFLILWATHIFSGFIASVLLLLRNRWTVSIALISAACTLIQTPLSFLLKNRWQAFGPFFSLFDIAIVLLSICFYLYCRKIKKYLR